VRGHGPAESRGGRPAAEPLAGSGPVLGLAGQQQLGPWGPGPQRARRAAGPAKAGPGLSRLSLPLAIDSVNGPFERSGGIGRGSPGPVRRGPRPGPGGPKPPMVRSESVQPAVAMEQPLAEPGARPAGSGEFESPASSPVPPAGPAAAPSRPGHGGTAPSASAARAP